MNKQVIYSIVLAVVVAGLSGCVKPGPVDQSLLAQSQRALAQKGPQERQAGQGLGALRPERVPGLGPLEVHQDDPSGEKYVKLSLEEAVMRALVNNLAIRAVSFDPTISREEVIKAAADFDYTVFGSFGYSKEDVRPASVFSGGQTKTHLGEAGLKQRFVTGAEWSLSWSMSRTWDNSGFSTPPTRYEPTLVFQVTQPLLRNAGKQLNLANLQATRLNERVSMAAFREKVEEVATQVISAYWGLVLAREDLGIQERLLELTEETYKRVHDRKDLDATAVEIEQARSAVESRRAVVVSARKSLGDAQDSLRGLLADPQINLVSDLEIVPVSDMEADPVKIAQDEQLATALGHNPLLEQARLTVDVAEIAVEVAENQKLPDVNVNASGTLQGLDGSFGSAHDRLFSGDYAGWSAGVSVEYPLGNRQRESQLRQSRAERLKAITVQQGISDQVAAQVKERIRQVQASYEQWLYQKEAVEASAKELDALEDTERIRGQLTPEFLNVKLQAQLALALAGRAQWQALTDYNVALVELARATGTVLNLYPVNSALPAVVGTTEGIGESRPVEIEVP